MAGGNKVTLTFAGDSTALEKTFKRVGSSADSFASKLGGGLKAGLKGGLIGLAGLGVGLVALAPKIVSSAANLELLGKKSATVFGAELPKVQAWAKAGAHSMGLTTREAVGLAAGMADLLKPMGFTSAQAATMSTKVVGLSGALAEWSGGTKSAAEVSDILNGALLGERDSLQQLGIGISQAQVDAQVLANKKRGLKFATQEQAEAQATLDLIMAKSTDAQKAYAEGSGTLARRMAESKARLREMAQTLLVAATPALKKIADLVAKYVMPALERFVNWVSGDGKFVIARSFLDMADVAVKMAQNMTKSFVGIAEKAVALGKVLAIFSPILRPVVAKADAELKKFKRSSEDAFGKARDEIAQWNSKLATMRTEARLKANITDLQTKLAAAQTALRNPNLTATKRAQIQANIADLQAKLTAAQRQINNLHGKTVVIKYSATGVNLTSPSSVGRNRAGGGSVDANMAYYVGEKGPEVYVPNRPGTIIPNSMLGRGGGRTIIEIRSGGSRLDNLLVELLRNAIRSKGGDVQVVLGS